MYTSLLLQQAYAQRVQELDKKVANMPRKTAAMQRRLTQQINELLSGANLANMVYSEAVPCRWVWVSCGREVEREQYVCVCWVGVLVPRQ